ncbi:MAG: RdgB/HAM1 family non-canonical purine NTP pyrophosphatase [Acidobacteria bacterium]|nr:RdgB/HAM1 family non-canonical purine NTP pyrophosphatase [Acidobacteriota bacterium]
MNPGGSLLVASKNPGKVREIREILALPGVSLLSLADVPGLPDCEEPGDTFAANARVKSEFYSHLTGLPTLGDDSGLEVDALGGAPGVRSARYAGPGASDADRITKLLAELAARPGAARTARFVCAVSLAEGGRELFAARGTCEGVITESPRGGNGFGYDPVFQADGTGLTYAELPDADKNALSHRGRALARLRDYLLTVTSSGGKETRAAGPHPSRRRV